MNYELLQIPASIDQNMPVVWTFLLLLTRFGTLLMFLPGLGAGMTGATVRYPAAVVFAFVSLNSSPVAALPTDWALLLLQMSSEVLLGFGISMLFLCVIAGVQTAGNIASQTMGLQASQLIDPTSQLSLPDIARLYQDLTINLFFVIGGHYAVIHAASGMAGTLVPGSFLVKQETIALLVDQSGDIFRVAVLVAAPVLVALLMTNFVLGVISKAVPTVNVFIVSFPLTVGIGLVLSAIGLPELVVFVTRELEGFDGTIHDFLRSAQFL